MSPNFFIKTFISIILGLPLTYLLAFVVNLGTYSNFQKFYKNSSPYQFTVGLVSYINKNFVQKRIIGNVHFGKDDYLFYLPRNDGNVWDDLFGKKVLSSEFTSKWQSYIEKQNDNYFFIVAPNKERILSEKLKLYTQPNLEAGRGAYELFPEHEKVLFSDKFLEEEDYYVSDTHWNLLAARKVVMKVLESKDIDSSFLSKAQVTSELRKGDITRMINHKGFELYPKKNMEKTLSLDFSSVKKKIIVKEEIVYFSNNKAPLKLKILVFGDSFRESIAKVLSATVEKVDSVKFVHVDHLKTLDFYAYDLILEVRVERYLDRMPGSE